MWERSTALTCLLCAFVVGGFGTKKDEENCEDVNNRCVARVGCGMAWKNFMLLCNDLLFGETTECTVHCTRALISLLSADDQRGMGFTDCDCGGDTACRLKKERVEVCSKPVLDVIRALDDSTVVECNMAVWLCEADASCQRALMYYVNHCEALLQGANCTDRCNSSLAVLYRHTKGAKLINCACAGVEECTTLRVNTDRLCFNENISYKLQNSSATSTPGLQCLTVFFCIFIHFTDLMRTIYLTLLAPYFKLSPARCFG